MLKYKTVIISSIVYNNTPKKEMLIGVSKETLERATSPFAEAIKENAKDGWAFHSMFSMHQRLARQKTVLEKIFGWIPLLGPAIFPRMKMECYEGIEYPIYMLVFVKEE